MKKLNLLLIVLFALGLRVMSQSCLPEGIEFTTQTEIDSFQINYPNCIVIEGDVFIGSWDGNTTITNLVSLICLTSIGGRLDIVRCENLTSLAGLSFNSTIGDWLLILENNSLSDLIGFQSLTTVGNGLAIEGNNGITSISGLESLVSIGGQLSIDNNNNLTNLSGLISLTEINGSLSIMTNVNLTDISGIENIDPVSIQEFLAIKHNYMLSNCAVYSVCDYIDNPSGLIVINDNNDGCNNQTEVETACEEFSVQNISIENNLLMFPNPATQTLTVSLKNGESISKISIYSLYGQEIISQKPIKNTINISKIQKGYYIIKIESEQFEYNKRLIIK